MASYKLYTKKIEQANSGIELAEIEDIIKDDNRLNEESKNLLLNSINDKLIALKPPDKAKNIENSRWILSDEYDVDDNLGKPDYKQLIPKDQTHIEWLMDCFYKDFIYIPNGNIQIPVLTALHFVNSKIIGNNTAMPMAYFLSNMPDSGKSTCAKQLGKYYNPEYYLYVGEDASGAGFRNDVSSRASKNQPTYILLDNFDPKLTRERIGVFYARLLKNTRSECIGIIADDKGGVVEFNTHAFKAFTSVYSLGGSAREGSELRSRCIHILFENASNKLKNSVDAWDWSNLPDEYFSIWKDAKKVNTVFKNLTIEIDRINPSSLNIYTRSWQISKHLLAVGVYVGVWSSIEDGINHLTNYWKWISTQEKGSKLPLQTFIESYVKTEHRKAVKAEMQIQNGEDLTMQMDKITLTNIYDFLKKCNLGITRSDTNNNKITETMLSLGWFSTLDRDSKGRVVDILFVQDIK